MSKSVYLLTIKIFFCSHFVSALVIKKNKNIVQRSFLKQYVTFAFKDAMVIEGSSTS